MWVDVRLCVHHSLELIVLLPQDLLGAEMTSVCHHMWLSTNTYSWVCVCEIRHTHAIVCMYRLEDNSLELVHFYLVGCRIEPRPSCLHVNTSTHWATILALNNYFLSVDCVVGVVSGTHSSTVERAESYQEHRKRPVNRQTNALYTFSAKKK